MSNQTVMDKWEQIDALADVWQLVYSKYPVTVRVHKLHNGTYHYDIFHDMRTPEMASDKINLIHRSQDQGQADTRDKAADMVTRILLEKYTPTQAVTTTKKKRKFF